MPYNYGVLMVNNTLAGKEAMLWLRDRVAKFGSAYQKWYGNQWALRELVGGSCNDPAPRRVHRTTGFWPIQIQVLECDKFNYTPQDSGEDLRGVYFVHAKGERDEMFQELAGRYA